MNFIVGKQVVVQFVAGMLGRFQESFRSITIIRQGRSEDYYVSIVTDTSLEETVRRAGRELLSKLMST